MFVEPVFFQTFLLNKNVMESNLSQTIRLQSTSDERDFSVAKSSSLLMLSSVGECSSLVCLNSFVFSLKLYVTSVSEGFFSEVLGNLLHSGDC